jgi:hypothetical protein
MTRSLRAWMAGAALLLILVHPTRAAAECAPGAGGILIGVAGGAFRYDVAGAMTGTEWGPEAGLASRLVTFRASYGQLDLDGSEIAPHVVRGSLRISSDAESALSLCLAAHGGATWFAAGDEVATALVGGVGMGAAVRTMVGRSQVVTFVEIRGLAGRTTGELLDMDVEASGMAVGFEGGARLRVGRLELRATGSLDGLAPGLGVTPYPARAVRVAGAIRL